MQQSLSKLISPGRRALTIPVDDESSISTMLKPGDLIDLIVTLQSAEKTATLPLMQGVKILATGNQLDSSSINSESTGYTNITLDVSADDAKNITLAASLGKISAILRNPNDQVVSDTSTFIQQMNAQKKLPLIEKPILTVPQQPLQMNNKQSSEKAKQSNFNIIYGNKDE